MMRTLMLFHSCPLRFPCYILLPYIPVMRNLAPLEARDGGELGRPFVDDLGDVFTVKFVLLRTVDHNHTFLAHL